MKTFNIDYNRIDELNNDLDDNNFIEYIFHRFFENSSIKYENWTPMTPGWKMPGCWLSRYHLYYDQCNHLLQDASILDIGSNLNFYNTWAILNGAKSVDYIEPDDYKFHMGNEYLTVRNMHDVIKGECIDINGFMNKANHKSYDVVFLLDVLYYTNNHIEIFKFMKDVIKPKTIFFECTVIDDVVEYPDGILKLWHPRTSPVIFESFHNSDIKNDNPLAMVPSRKALFNIIDSAGFTVDSIYDYKDYTGDGESSPRMAGNKVFMILK